MAIERGSGNDSLNIGVGLGIMEKGHHWTNFQVEKWDTDQIKWTQRKDYDGQRLIRRGVEPVALDFKRLKCKPFETYLKEDANLITNAGWVFMVNGIAGSGVTKFNNGTVGRIGLGTSATAVTAADTNLNSVGALTANNWKVINAVPTVGAGGTAALIVAAQFITTDANGVAIAEFAVDSGTTNTNVVTGVAPMLSHGNASPGSKTSAQTWNATVTYNFT